MYVWMNFMNVILPIDIEGCKRLIKLLLQMADVQANYEVYND